MGSSLEEINAALQDRTHRVVLYIGSADDDNWATVEAACKLGPGVDPYRVDSFDVVTSLLTPGDYVAVVFGWNGMPTVYISAADAADIEVVLNKIAAGAGR